MNNGKLEHLELNKKGVNQLLKCPAVQNYIEELARKQAARAGEGYEYRINHSSKDGRVTAIVRSKSGKAKQDNLDNNTLLKSTQG
ncbi:hypothetical protein [Bulleidia sp. zg-1006]|nr:hypothetical protein [Bulleidia sp. zg-1006]QRG86374.1 hypothetical protein JOS54_05840 [Bulleidia sp. zg-1006]